MTSNPVKLSGNERYQIKLARELVQNERQQEALKASLLAVGPAHRRPLRGVLTQLEKKKVATSERLIQTERDLEWENLLLKPVLWHVQHLASSWQGSAHSLVAQRHLDNLAKFGVAICKHYDKKADPSSLISKFASLEDSAPLASDQHTAVSAFYPKQAKRLEMAGAVWKHLLKEMAKSNQWVEHGVHGVSGWLDSYVQTAKIAMAVLDGSANKIEKSLECDSISPSDFKFVSRFAEDNLYDDDYKEDKQARKAFEQAQSLQGRTPVTTSTRSRRL